MDEYTISLYNNKFCNVSEEDYKHLNQYTWSICNGYLYSTINNKNWRIHRYIYEIILKENIEDYYIDHIDNNPLNNKRDNLRKVNASENGRNRKKKDDLSSKYMGVSWNKNQNKNNWHSQIVINSKKIHAFYDKEEHAGHQYNLWCVEFNLHTANLNIINGEYLKDFILFQKRDKRDKLPKNIRLTKTNNFTVDIKNKQIGTYTTLLEANIVRNFMFNQNENQKQDKILNTPIKRNKDNQAIIEIFNKNKEKIEETVVDDKLYYDLIQCRWNSTNKYIANSKKGFLHRYVMNYNGKDIVDHINGNPLDNRKENLRVITQKQNTMNKKSAKNSTSKYIGVRWNKRKNKWNAMIKINNKGIHLGTFSDEDEAAKARDIGTQKYFGIYGKLNFPIV